MPFGHRLRRGILRNAQDDEQGQWFPIARSGSRRMTEGFWACRAVHDGGVFKMGLPVSEMEMEMARSLDTLSLALLVTPARDDGTLWREGMAQVSGLMAWTASRGIHRCALNDGGVWA